MGQACCAAAPKLSEIVGSPTAALMPAGQCQFSHEPSMCPLLSRVQITHDTFVVTFKLPDDAKPLGLPTCACILAVWSRGIAAGDPITRPYTPISTNAMVGKFQLLIKLYPGGQMSNYLHTLPLGQSVMFKHIEKNVKLQYPFQTKHITMLVGGTGITPMIQALHAILGSAGDTTKVSMIFGNKTQDDILGRELLDTWAANSKDGRFTVTHVLSNAQGDSSWQGEKGFISRELIQKCTPASYANPLIMVCGPPAMYDALCGPRDVKDVTGILGQIGYTPEQVYKF